MLPVILCHGICRFDIISHGIETILSTLRPIDDDSFNYFRKIKSTLRNAFPDIRVYEPNVSWAGTVRQRAMDLNAFIQANLQPGERFHIIGHSMGGLDARHLIYDFQNIEMHKRVASINTISTPHNGTPFADWGLRNLQELIKLSQILHFDINGFRDLTTTACKQFNVQSDMFERLSGVKIRTYAGVQDVNKTFLLLRPAWNIIEPVEGPNDGLVSLKSAKYKDEYFIKQITADHLNECGWWDVNDGFDFAIEQQAQNLYVDIMRDIALMQ